MGVKMIAALSETCAIDLRNRFTLRGLFKSRYLGLVDPLFGRVAQMYHSSVSQPVFLRTSLRSLTVQLKMFSSPRSTSKMDLAKAHCCRRKHTEP